MIDTLIGIKAVYEQVCPKCAGSKVDNSYFSAELYPCGKCLGLGTVQYDCIMDVEVLARQIKAWL
jgi:reverse gyrase